MVIYPFAPYGLAHGPKKLLNQVPLGSPLCGPHISEIAGWIYTVQSSMVFYKPVVVQYHGLMTFTLDFQGQIMKKHIKGIGRLVDTERKGCESIGSGTHFVVLKFDPSHDLDLDFSRWNFKKAVFREWEGWLTWNNRDVSWSRKLPSRWTHDVTLSYDLDLGFSRTNFEKSCND